MTIIPGSSRIDIKDLVDADTLASVDTEGTKPRENYYKLAITSATQLGTFIAQKIQHMQFPDNTDQLENICSSFCMKLNAVYDQQIQGAVATSVISDMLSSLLDSIAKARLPELLQARITRCLVSRISISRSQKSHTIIDILLNVAKDKRICFCDHTVEELLDVCDFFNLIFFFLFAFYLLIFILILINVFQFRWTLMVLLIFPH